MIEEWRPVDWAPDYEVSSLGNVRSWKPYPWNAPAPTEPRPLRATRNQETGYHSVQLYYGTGTSRRAVHRLVAEAFVPNPYGLPEVAHRNGDQTDNRACNLRWSTKADNEADKLEHGTLRFGSKNPLSRLTDQDVRKIRALRNR